MTTQEFSLTESKTFRLSEEAQRLLHIFSKRYGIHQTAVIEIILRNQAKQENIPTQ